ncbi:MAG: cytochrome P450 [Caulobacterales bacterium]|nr:cytochrome P450 [Caulobacterales bacterium]
MADSPFDAYDELRRAAPAYREPRYGNVVLTRYEDVARLREHEKFGAEHGVDPAGRFPAGAYPDIERTDPPRHSRLKAFLFPFFSASAVAGWTAQVRQIFDEHFDDLPDGPFDIVKAVCYPAPAAVICDIMGFDRERRGDFQRWSEALVDRLGEEISEEQRESLREMARFIRSEAEARREARGEGLLSELVHAEVDGERLTIEEIIAHGVFFLAAGHETTTNFLGSFTSVLLDDPSLFDRLAADRSLIPAALEETLRLQSPVQNICRTARVDMVLHGCPVAADSRVMFSLGAANRDPGAFSEPDAFRLDRENGRAHMAFGYGHHLCMGARLARLEGEIFANRLFDRFSTLRRAGDFERAPGSVIRGYRRLMVEGDRSRRG